MTVFDELLGVQEHDTAADRLRHRRATLPELAELTQVEDTLVTTEVSLEEWTARAAEVARRQSRLEDELAAVEAKIVELEGRLYSGAVTIPRELQAMQADVDSLRRRRGAVEDQVLEAMTEREPLDQEVLRLEQARDRLDVEGARLRAVIAETQADIDRHLAEELQARTAAAATLPGDLATLYEQLRAQMGGIGAARLVNGRCGGCHLNLPATEVDRIRREPPETLIRCDQCGRVLVR